MKTEVMKSLLSPQSTFLASVMLVAGQDKVDKLIYASRDRNFLFLLRKEEKMD